MSSISAHLIFRVRDDRSYLSATCPAVAESKKKGKMKIPVASVTMMEGLMPVDLATS